LYPGFSELKAGFGALVPATVVPWGEAVGEAEEVLRFSSLWVVWLMGAMALW